MSGKYYKHLSFVLSVVLVISVIANLYGVYRHSKLRNDYTTTLETIMFQNKPTTRWNSNEIIKQCYGDYLDILRMFRNHINRKRNPAPGFVRDPGGGGYLQHAVYTNASSGGNSSGEPVRPPFKARQALEKGNK